MRSCLSRHILGCAGGHQSSTTVTALGAEIDDPVGRLDDIEIVLDHHHGITFVTQSLQHEQQLRDVVKMQARGWFIEDVERPAGCPLGKLAGKFDALRFTA